MNNLTNLKKNILNKIKCLYGLNENASELLQEYLEGETCDLNQLQQVLVDFIFHDKVLNMYEPYKKYRRSFLKKIISIVENKEEEVNETLLNNYIQLINQVSETNHDEPEKYFLVIFPQVI